MPGRARRWACNCSISAARSITAASAAFFWRSQFLPPILASVGRDLLPPMYFWTRPIFEAGT